MFFRPVLPTRSFSALARRLLPTPSLPFPTTLICPPAICTCPDTPELDIDHESKLAGLVGQYAQHLVIATGQDDWTSRIENDGEGTGWGSLVSGLKGQLRRDPFNSILITNSSFRPSSNTDSNDSSETTAFLFPSRILIPRIPTSITSDISTFVRAFLQPKTLHAGHYDLPEETRAEMVRDCSLQSCFPGIMDISEEVVVLICGHGGRDMRCGVMGPLLKIVFEDVLSKKGHDVNPGQNQLERGPKKRARVGLISHIGGHKFAGNVIIYMPSKPPKQPLHAEGEGTGESLLGKGIWYGRVQPLHVPGLVDETILQGKLVLELLRGVVGSRGELYRP